MNVCAICAWRGTCNKKFTVCGRDMYCPDFVRDVTIKSDDEDRAEKAKGAGKEIAICR